MLLAIVGACLRSTYAVWCPGDAKVILCILPAPQDLSTNEAVLLARKFDRSGDRTVGVITKPDQRGDDLVAHINNCRIKVGKGFVMVRADSFISD